MHAHKTRCPVFQFLWQFVNTNSHLMVEFCVYGIMLYCCSEPGLFLHLYVCLCVTLNFCVHSTMYFKPIQRQKCWLSCNELSVRCFALHVYQQSGKQRLSGLLCMANLLNSLNIEVKAYLCDCQFTSSSGLCYSSEYVK